MVLRDPGLWTELWRDTLRSFRLILVVCNVLFMCRHETASPSPRILVAPPPTRLCQGWATEWWGDDRAQGYPLPLPQGPPGDGVKALYHPEAPYSQPHKRPMLTRPPLSPGTTAHLHLHPPGDLCVHSPMSPTSLPCPQELLASNAVGRVSGAPAWSLAPSPALPHAPLLFCAHPDLRGEAAGLLFLGHACLQGHFPLLEGSMATRSPPPGDQAWEGGWSG